MARKRTEWLKIGTGKTYAHRVHYPLQCLIFIFPLLLFYQIATAIHPYATSETLSPHVMAFVLMLRFFGFFGAVLGTWLPPLTVVAILLFWHLARKDPWDFDLKLYGGMLLESVLWALPIVVIGLALSRRGLMAWGWPLAAGTDMNSWQSEVVLSVGAGVYEELLFRVICITALNILLVDIFELKVQWAIPIIIVVSSVLFSAYHLLGANSTDASKAGVFLFRTAMGVYLTGIYIYRGYGITVGAHTLYDLFVVFMTHM